MKSFKQFVIEANFSVDTGRGRMGAGVVKTASQRPASYPVQTGAQQQYNPPVQQQAVQPYSVAPAVTQRNVATATYPVQTTAPTQAQQTGMRANGQLTARDLKPVGKYNAGPSGARQWYGNTALLNPRAADAFLAAQQAYGQQIPINSAYRNLEHQRGLSGEGHKVVGRAGTSRHGLGMAIDIQPNTPAYNWFMRNGPQFGWHFASIKGDPFHFEFRG